MGGMGAENTGMSERSAQKLMQTARSVSSGSSLARLPISKITTILSLPEPEREPMAERAVTEDMSLRELQEAVKREKQRADQLAAEKAKSIARATAAERELGNLKADIPKLAENLAEEYVEKAAEEIDALREQLEQARAQATPATGISQEAQAEIDRLTNELARPRTMQSIKPSCQAQRAQQELLNQRAQAARGESTGCQLWPRGASGSRTVFCVRRRCAAAYSGRVLRRSVRASAPKCASTSIWWMLGWQARAARWPRSSSAGRHLAMENRELMQIQPGTPSTLPAEVQATLAQMGDIMRSMANMLRATNERMASLEREVKLLTKVTPAQANAINNAIRQRAAELCETYRAQGCEKAAANAIRRAVRLTTGTNSVRDLPRCEYSVAMEQVRMWDDRKTMKALRAKVNKQEATL